MFWSVLHRGRMAAFVCSLSALTPLLIAAPAAAGARVDLGGGSFFAFNDEHRRAYGSSPVFSGGVSSGFGSGSARIFLEVGYLRASGSETSRDPTFEMDESTYRLVPISLGLRGDANSAPTQPLRIFFGVGWQTVFTSWDGPDTGAFSTPTFGPFLELQPEYRIDRRWRIWFRQRFTLLADAAYENTFQEIDYSGSSLEVGVGYRLGQIASPPQTPSRNDS